MRWRNWRKLWSLSRSRNSGWPIRTICRSFRSSVSRLESSRTCSSSSRRQILRLVNNQHRVLVALDLLKQKAVDLRHRFQAVQALDLQIQLHGNGLDQLIGVQHGIEDQGGGKFGAKLFQQGAAEGGFARADLAGQLDKALALANAVEQMVEGLAMLGAEKQEPRIGCNVKGRFLQPVIFQVHALELSQNHARGKTICRRHLMLGAYKNTSTFSR